MFTRTLCRAARNLTLAPPLALALATAALAQPDAGHVLGRWAGLPQAAFLPPAQAGGLGAKVRVTIRLRRPLRTSAIRSGVSSRLR